MTGSQKKSLKYEVLDLCNTDNVKMMGYLTGQLYMAALCL